MSKPVTNEEVEDVLSSIRRLVSEDKRPLAGLRATPPETRGSDETPPANDAASDRLVLTPALRVTEPVETPLDLGAVAERTWPPQDKAEAASDGADVEALVDPTLDISEQDGEDHADYSDESYWNADKGETGKGNSDKDVTWKEATVSAAVDRSGEIVDDTDVFEDDPDGNRYRPEAVLGQPAEVLGQTTEEDGDARTREEAAGSMAGEDTARVVPQAHNSRDEGGQNVDDTRDGDTDVNGAALADTGPGASYFFDPKAVQEAIPDKAGASLTAKIAALEAAVGETVQEWEPDGGEAEDLTSSATPTMAWEDDVELDAKGSPLDDGFPDKSIADADADADAGAQIRQEAPDDVAPQKEPQADEPPIAAAFGTGDDQIMDEDALRDLVSEIVREELQGALGERITRNVRKLVRREIHRALTAQEME